MKTITRLILILFCCFAIGKTSAQTATFSYSGSIVNWTVPCGVNQLTIAATGATGGNVTGYTPPGGKGAEMIGTFTVTPGSTLKILVGGAGGIGTCCGGGGGGGGGTFVTTNTNVPLIVAGGGGGVDAFSNTYTSVGIDAVITTSGVNGYSALGGSPANYGIGGVGGDGATNNGSPGPCAGNGGGLLTNGQAPGCCAGTSGFAFVNGGAGGAGCVAQDGNGGFGGGGGGGNTGGGGGGGYSGGGGSYNDPVNGGGGGSYNAGSNQTNTAAFNSAGNGGVIISWVVPTGPVVTASVVSNVSCNGDNNGSISTTVTGGSTPYTYLWTPSSQTNATATSLVANIYTVTVTDACGNTATASATVTQPNILMATATASANVSCNGGSNGATSSTVSGGTTPYTYAWTGGSTNNTATGLTAGTYTLNVTDSHGCTATASAAITQPNMLSVSSSVTANVLCHGDSTGSASSSVSGGTMPYTYSWAPGGGTTDTAIGLKAGTYTLSVMDANGCTGTAMVSITQPTAISLSSTSTPDNGTHNGTATVTATGGMMPYTFKWSPGGNTTASISGKDSGMYCCTVSDSNGCKDSICVHIKSIAGIAMHYLIQDKSPYIQIRTMDNSR